mmetsp:Transcript_114591/g.262987  ORF Transcript_114591/g.262987 Transcript_114591/m.262987 type:complete len:405 (-) Transcript_114591:1068-2282(-)
MVLRYVLTVHGPLVAHDFAGRVPLLDGEEKFAAGELTENRGNGRVGHGVDTVVHGPKEGGFFHLGISSPLVWSQLGQLRLDHHHRSQRCRGHRPRHHGGGRRRLLPGARVGGRHDVWRGGSAVLGPQHRWGLRQRDCGLEGAGAAALLLGDLVVGPSSGAAVSLQAAPSAAVAAVGDQPPLRGGGDRHLGRALHRATEVARPGTQGHAARGKALRDALHYTARPLLQRLHALCSGLAHVAVRRLLGRAHQFRHRVAHDHRLLSRPLGVTFQATRHRAHDGVHLFEQLIAGLEGGATGGRTQGADRGGSVEQNLSDLVRHPASSFVGLLRLSHHHGCLFHRRTRRAVRSPNVGNLLQVASHCSGCHQSHVSVHMMHFPPLLSLVGFVILRQWPVKNKISIPTQVK